jgi:hypothetical protein
MIQKILGFALIAFVALIVLKVAFGLLGVLIGFAVSLLVLAALGYALYLVLRMVSPATADRILQTIRSTPKAEL